MAPECFPAERGWLSDLFDEENQVYERQAREVIELSQLVAKKRCLVGRRRSSETTAAMQDLLSKAYECDQGMKKWRSRLPDHWHPRTIAYVNTIPDDINIPSACAWIGPVHVYRDLHIASMTNKHRGCRAMCAQLVMEILTWLLPDMYHLDHRYLQARHVEQEMTDEMCASIPYHFGLWAEKPGNDGPVGEWNRESFTALPLVHTQRSYRTPATEFIGGFSLIWPVRAVADSDTLPEKQRKWLHGRLAMIANHYGLEQAVALDGM